MQKKELVAGQEYAYKWRKWSPVQRVTLITPEYQHLSTSYTWTDPDTGKPAKSWHMPYSAKQRGARISEYTRVVDGPSGGRYGKTYGVPVYFHNKDGSYQGGFVATRGLVSTWADHERKQQVYEAQEAERNRKAREAKRLREVIATQLENTPLPEVVGEDWFAVHHWERNSKAGFVDRGASFNLTGEQLLQFYHACVSLGQDSNEQ
jgi:hypothetical protein